MPLQARPTTYTLKRSVTSWILQFWMAKIRQESATPFYFFKAFNTFYSALMQNMPAITACNQSKSIRHQDFGERSSLWAKEESDSCQLRDDTREVAGAVPPLWGLALAAASHSGDVQVPRTAQPHLFCCTQRIQNPPFTAGASCVTLQTGYCPQHVEFGGVFFKVSWPARVSLWLQCCFAFDAKCSPAGWYYSSVCQTCWVFKKMFKKQ